MSRDKLTKLINHYQEHIEDDTRDYIGASSIGSDCLRQIWYQFKGVKSEGVPARVRRTWDIGKKLEGLILDWLENSGIKIERNLGDLYSKKVPTFKGHLDSVLVSRGKNLQVPKSIIEIKTAKDASFKMFVKKGAQTWNPQYYAQIQSYMGMSNIYSAYILVLNKDNSDLSDELITFDEEYYKQLEEKALMISKAVVTPPRVNESPLWYQCKLCKYHKICHN